MAETELTSVALRAAENIRQARQKVSERYPEPFLKQKISVDRQVENYLALQSNPEEVFRLVARHGKDEVEKNFRHMEQILERRNGRQI